MALASFSPDYNFDQFGYNAKGNNKRHEDDFLRIQSDKFSEYAGRFAHIAKAELEIKQQFKDLDKVYKDAGFDVSTAKKGLKSFMRKLKKPDEENVLAIIHEWIEKDTKLRNAIRELVEVDDDTKAQWEAGADDRFEHRLKEIGDFSKENYRRAVEDLKYTSDDFSREDLAKRAHFGEENAMRQLYELDVKMAMEKGEEIPPKPDFINELEKPKEYSEEEIQQAEITNAQTKKLLMKFTEDHNIKEDEKYWLDLGISTSDLMDFEMHVIAPWMRLPEELRDNDIKEMMSLIKEYERYTAKWFDYMSSGLNPAMATVLPARLKTKGNLDNFGTTQELSDRYLKWCRQFSKEKFVFYIDPNFKADLTLPKKDWIRKLYVGGYAYPEEIRKENHPDGIIAGCFEYPEEPNGDYVLERTKVFQAQPYFFRDSIQVPEWKDEHRWVQFDRLRKVMDVEILPDHEVQKLRERGQFGKDYFIHMENESINEETTKSLYKQTEEYLNELLITFQHENALTCTSNYYIDIFVASNDHIKQVRFYMDVDTKTASKEVILEVQSPEEAEMLTRLHNRGLELHEVPKELTYTDINGDIISEKEFQDLLNAGHLWDSRGYEVGYRAEDDLYFKEFNTENPRQTVFTKIKNQPKAPEQPRELEELLQMPNVDIEESKIDINDETDAIIDSLFN